MKNTQLAEGNLFAHKMYVELYVFCAAVMNRVSRHVDRGDVVAEHHARFGHGNGELCQELAKPAAFGDGIGDGAVLRLRAGARDGVLALRRLGDEVVAEEDAEARCRTACVGATRPVRV